MKITFAQDADDMMLTMIDGLQTSSIFVKITYAVPPTRAVYQVEGVIKSRTDEELIVSEINPISGEESKEVSIPLTNIAQIEVQ
jgi:hypothetical protein